MTETVTNKIDSDALKYILSMPRGRKVIWDILAAAGLYHQPRVPGDTEGTAFNCGQKNVALIVWVDCLTADPELAALMIKEQGTYDNLPEQPRTKRNRTSGNTASGDASGNTDPGDPASDSSGELPFSRFFRGTEE